MRLARAFVLMLIVVVCFSMFSFLHLDVREVSAAQSAADATDWWPMFHHDPNHSGYSTSAGPSSNQILLWSYTTNNSVYSCPAIVNGIVYVGSMDDSVYALNAATGTLMWKFATGNSVWSSPAVAYGVVYVGSMEGKVYALNATTGILVWKYTCGTVDSCPAVVNGIVYVGSQDNYLYALNATTGVLVWKTGLDGSVFSSPAVADGAVFVGSGDDNVYALNATTGAQVWNYTTGAEVYSSPAVANGIVYVGSFDSYVYALNETTGALVWKYAFSEWEVLSSPAVANGLVYVGSIGLYGCGLDALNATTGMQVWNYTTGGYGVDSSPAVANGIVYVGSLDDNLYALNAVTGALVWKYTTGDWVESSPAVVGDMVYVGSDDGKVYAFGPPPHNVGIVDVSPFGNWTYQGWSINVNVTVANGGDYVENATVNLYYSGTAGTGLIGTEPVVLAEYGTETLTFAWNTTSVPVCYSGYNITATVDISPEINSNTTNNVLQSPLTVQVRILGDVNGEGVVNMDDIMTLLSAFGSYPGHPRWNPDCDLNQCGRVDLSDIVAALMNYGKSS